MMDDVNKKYEAAVSKQPICCELALFNVFVKQPVESIFASRVEARDQALKATRFASDDLMEKAYSA